MGDRSNPGFGRKLFFGGGECYIWSDTHWCDIPGFYGVVASVAYLGILSIPVDREFPWPWEN